MVPVSIFIISLESCLIDFLVDYALGSPYALSLIHDLEGLLAQHNAALLTSKADIFRALEAVDLRAKQVLMRLDMEFDIHGALCVRLDELREKLNDIRSKSKGKQVKTRESKGKQAAKAKDTNVSRIQNH